MSAAAQNNPEVTLGRHCQSLTLIDPYTCPHEKLCLGRVCTRSRPMVKQTAEETRSHETIPRGLSRELSREMFRKRSANCYPSAYLSMAWPPKPLRRACFRAPARTSGLQHRSRPQAR
jgi:hypothetical protein